MILADDIIAAACTRMNAVSFGSLGRLASKVEKAERFVLDRQTVNAVKSVCQSSPRSIVAAKAFARAPFEMVWIEWNFRDILDAIGCEPACKIDPLIGGIGIQF